MRLVRRLCVRSTSGMSVDAQSFSRAHIALALTIWAFDDVVASALKTSTVTSFLALNWRHQ